MPEADLIDHLLLERWGQVRDRYIIYIQYFSDDVTSDPDKTPSDLTISSAVGNSVLLSAEGSSSVLLNSSPTELDIRWSSSMSILGPWSGISGDE